MEKLKTMEEKLIKGTHRHDMPAVQWCFSLSLSLSLCCLVSAAAADDNDNDDDYDDDYDDAM